jgi:hypothetical protein
MTRATRNIVAFALIAAYGGISLLGHGLHWLVPENGHHHGHEIVRCAVHGSEHHHGHAHHADESCPQHGATLCETQHDESPSVTAGDYIAHSHNCEICAFLALASGERPQICALFIAQHVAGSVPLSEQLAHSSATFGWHSPRGPPCLG